MCRLKITTVMKKPSEFGSLLQGEPTWESFLSVIRFTENKGYVLFTDRRKRKWIWVTLVGLASIQSYFVRELVAALFFFTIFYVFLAALVVLYILFVDALDHGSVWLGSFGRSFLSLVHHHFASPARVPSLPKDRAVHRIQKLDPDSIFTTGRRKA
jgi:hypothetical protein